MLTLILFNVLAICHFKFMAKDVNSFLFNVSSSQVCVCVCVGELELLGGGLPTRLFTCTCYFMGFLSYIVRATHAQAALDALDTL